MNFLSDVLGNFKMRVLKSYYYGSKRRFQTDGIQYDLDLSEMIDLSLFVKGYYEFETSRALAHLLKPGMNVIEVGANVGAHTFRMAKRVGPNGSVHAFEPTKYAFSKLSLNHKLNKIENIYLNQIAITRAEESGKIVQRGFKSSWDSITGKSNHRCKHEVQLCSIDDYVVRSGIKTIDLVKMDIDGREYAALSGGQQTLAKFHPLLVLETGTNAFKHNSSPSEVVDLLKNLGYEFYKMNEEKPLNPIRLNQLLMSTPSIDLLCK